MKAGTPLADAEARARIAADLGATLFVEAAAGTGKTTALVSRIVSLLREGVGTLEGIVAVTFTEKAAGEMKLRLRAEIESVRGAPELEPAQRERLDAALAQLEVARIGTIHAFCAELLRERPVEAGVDPLFEVAPEDEEARLLERAFESWFQRVLEDPPEGVRRVLRRRPRGWDAQGPRDDLQAAARNLVQHRDFPAPWRRPEGWDRAAAIDAVLAQLTEVGALAARAARAEDYLAQNLAEIQRFVDEVRHREAVRARDYDGLEAELRGLSRSRFVHWHWRDSPRKPFADGLPRDEVIAQRNAARQALDALLAQADADLAACLREELRPVVEAYEALKQRAGRLDFLDLLLRARNLVARDRAVREDLQARFSHFFVDEFQDTDPLQAEIVLLLSADDPAQTDWREVTPVPGKLFLVGDPKQSIYRFRRADVALYEEAKRLLWDRGAEVLNLTTSFRSLPEIQAAVNTAFEPAMGPGADGTQAEYVALEHWRAEIDERPSVVALPVPRPYKDWGNNARVTQFQIEESLPDAVGAFVDWLVNHSGWTVEEPGGGGERVPVQARHVCLLFRRFRKFRDDVTRPYVRALEARRVPHVLVGGRSFHDREEVLAVRNALCAIEWPDDELRVFATLRGPLFALEDAVLLGYRHRAGRLHPLRWLDPAALESLDGLPEPTDDDRAVAEALAVLARLHVGRNQRAIGETLSRLLGAVRAHAGIAIWPTGEQALANCLRTLDLARRFERQGAPSFRAFVEQLEREAERGDAQEAPVVEEGTEGVRIMTVHKAKGLEFPVVILADPTCKAARETPTRHVDPVRGLWAEPLCGSEPLELREARSEELLRDTEEAVRLAYVAATRARDLLVAPVVGDWGHAPNSYGGEDEDRGGWLGVLRTVLYPEPGARRAGRAAPGCPRFGDDSVLERPASARRGPSASVRPGLHVPDGAAHAVVWWDPRALELGREEQVGLRQQRILEADAEGIRAEQSVRAHQEWQAARRAALDAGARPSLRVESVTALAAEAADEERAEAGSVRVEEVALDRSTRPGGPRFGTLVHAVLASVDLGADADRVGAAARLQGRLLGAPREEVEAAAVAARAALAHPLLRRAARSARAGGLRRETPVLLRLSDGRLADGVVDLAFRETSGAGEVGRWTVVDFKTDRELSEQRTRYQAQVRLYARAVSAATGEAARGVLLVV